MIKRKIPLVAVLTLAWMVLMESYSLFTVASGVFVSGCCVFFSSRFLPLDIIKGVSFGKLAASPFYLLGQIFVSASYVTKIIFVGAKIDIVNIRTKVKNNSVRIMLADSITLTPGSVMLELDGDNMTILWLRERGSPEIDALEEQVVAENIMGKLERKLIVAQKEVGA